MKKALFILLSALSFMGFKSVPRGVIVVGSIAYANSVHSQNPGFLNWNINVSRGTLEAQMLYFPTRNVISILDTTNIHLKLNDTYFDSLTSRHTSTSPVSFAGFDNNGKLLRYSMSSIPASTLSASQVTAALGYVPLQIEVDGSITNELQTISVSGQSLSISSGNTVILPTSTLTSLTASTGISVTSGSVITNTSPDKTVSIAGSGINVTSAYPNFTLSLVAVATHTASRSISSGTFQVSATNVAWVYYTVRISCNASIGSSSSGTVALQYSTDSGSTWVDVGQIENSNTVTLAVALNSTTIETAQLCGVIPAGAIVRINQTTAGTTTITFVRGQENY